jgi:hypothetical protein
MEDWIARAINSAKDPIQKDAAVVKDALRCNRWIASSALQKAIRRGDTAIALRAAMLAFVEKGDEREWYGVMVFWFWAAGGVDIQF